jgi:hypothetical protein
MALPSIAPDRLQPSGFRTQAFQTMDVKHCMARKMLDSLPRGLARKPLPVDRRYALDEGHRADYP